MKDSSSPEDKLLKLIRNPKKPAGTNIKPQAKINKAGPSFSLRRIFFWLFIPSGIYLIANLVYPWVGLKNIRLPQPSQTLPQESPGAKSAGKPLEEYLESARGRQIFSQAAALEDNSFINAANTDLMKDISLVGIISGENPQAVIEDKKTQKTYYVTKGKFIGEMQVEDIQEGKIIINYGGQKYELYM